MVVIMNTITPDLVVIGAGPAGYASAFRAADLGMKVILLDKRNMIGGVCLHEGCIPSKALLNVVKILHEITAYKKLGIFKDTITVDTKQLRSWIQSSVIDVLSNGLSALSNKRSIPFITGQAYIEENKSIIINNQILQPKNIIIATGSRPIRLKFIPEDPRIWDSTSALQLECTTGHLFIIGAGIIGCELACVYVALGMQVSICDIADRIMPGIDKELAKIMQQELEKQGIVFHLSTSLQEILNDTDSLKIIAKQHDQTVRYTADRVLLAMGRIANIEQLWSQKLNLLTNKNLLTVDNQFNTSVPNIYAVGDVIGGHLAHEATAQGRLCAEILAGRKRKHDVKAMPSVAYTYPEVAWIGKTEEELKNAGTSYKTATISWKANGRAVATLQTVGQTTLFANDTGQLIGAHILGCGAGDLIGELALALEMNIDIEDLALTIHPHPTTSETIMLASEVIEGTATDQ